MNVVLERSIKKYYKKLNYAVKGTYAQMFLFVCGNRMKHKLYTYYDTKIHFK